MAQPLASHFNPESRIYRGILELQENYGASLERMKKIQKLFFITLLCIFRMSKLSGNPKPDFNPAELGRSIEKLGRFHEEAHILLLDHGEFLDACDDPAEIDLYLDLHGLFLHREDDITDEETGILIRALVDLLQDQPLMETSR